MTPRISELESAGVEAPHGGQPMLAAGATLVSAAAAVVLLHGRGADARDILSLADSFAVERVHYIAPQAAGNSWYPQSFLAPIASNQPGIDSAHAVIEHLIAALGKRGLGAERIGLVGFSQGACVAVDHAVRVPRRYGIIAAFTGGLIGPPGTQFSVAGSLEGTPAFLGSSDPDPHVPWARVRESAGVLEGLGARVRLDRFPGLPHSVNEHEIEVARRMLQGMISEASV